MLPSLHLWLQNNRMQSVKYKYRIKWALSAKTPARCSFFKCMDLIGNLSNRNTSGRRWRSTAHAWKCIVQVQSLGFSYRNKFSSPPWSSSDCWSNFLPHYRCSVPKCLLLTTPSLSLVSQVLHPQLQFQQTISFTHVRKIYVTAC